MKYIRILLKSLREFKKPTLITMLLMVFEVFIEVLIPFITADLVNDIKAGAPLEQVAKTGLILVVMALVSLGCGTLGGITCSKASAGFAKYKGSLRGKNCRCKKML